MHKKLHFYEFTLLSESEQFALVFLEGEFKSSSETDNRVYCLYKRYNFFVELEYDLSENKIVGETAFQQKE
jgi:hypothetical protein